MDKFCPGDQVYIKPYEEIRKTLRLSSGGILVSQSCPGLMFLDSMRQYCGASFGICQKNADRDGGDATYWLQDIPFSWLGSWLKPVPSAVDVDVGGLL